MTIFQKCVFAKNGSSYGLALITLTALLQVPMRKRLNHQLPSSRFLKNTWASLHRSFPPCRHCIPVSTSYQHCSLSALLFSNIKCSSDTLPCFDHMDFDCPSNSQTMCVITLAPNFSFAIVLVFIAMTTTNRIKRGHLQHYV